MIQIKYSNNIKRLTVRIPELTYERLKNHCQVHNVSQTQIIKCALEKYLNGEQSETAET